MKHMKAKAAIDNCRAGRAAKGENPFIRATQAYPFQGRAFCMARMKVLRVTQITVGSREARPNTEIKNKGEAYRRDDAFWKMIAFSLALAPRGFRKLLS